MRSSVLFWNWHILPKSHSPWLVLLGLLQLSSCQEFLPGALPPAVGWSFFWAGSSPPDIKGLASVAIWANCWDSDNCGDLPASSSHSASATILLISSWSGGISLLELGVYWCRGPLRMALGCHSGPYLSNSFSLPLPGHHLSSHHAGI